MDQPNPSTGGPQMPEAPKQPLVAPWLLWLFVIVLLGGGGYLVWYFMQ